MCQHAPGKFKQRPAFLFNTLVKRHIRCGAAHHQQGIAQPGIGNGSFARVVVGRYVGLDERILMAFIQDDGTQIGEGCEKGAARTDDNGNFCLARAQPGVQPLTSPEAVNAPHPTCPGKRARKRWMVGRGQRDLGHSARSPAVCGQHLADNTQVQFGFT